MRKITKHDRFYIGQKIYRKIPTKFHLVKGVDKDIVYYTYSEWGNQAIIRNCHLDNLLAEGVWYVHDITEYFEAINNK